MKILFILVTSFAVFLISSCAKGGSSQSGNGGSATQSTTITPTYNNGRNSPSNVPNITPSTTDVELPDTE